MATLKFLVNTVDIYFDIYNNKDNLADYLLKNHKVILTNLNSDKQVTELDINKILRSELIKENFPDFYEFSSKYMGDKL